RTHAFLAGSRTRCFAAFKARKYVFERYHAGIDEHQCRVIVRHEWRGRDYVVLSSTKIIKEPAANIIGRCHNESDLGNDSPPCKPDMHFAVPSGISIRSALFERALICGPRVDRFHKFRKVRAVGGTAHFNGGLRWKAQHNVGPA
ncbi:MAG: hypothetical protein RL209_861, partial [Pseudomonadota bacterium]